MPLPVPGFMLSPSGGSLFYGSKGIMSVTSHSASVRLIPETLMAERASSLPPKSIPRVIGGPFKEWTRAIRGGPVCGSNFDYSAPLTEVVLLGVDARLTDFDQIARAAQHARRRAANLHVGMRAHRR